MSEIHNASSQRAAQDTDKPIQEAPDVRDRTELSLEALLLDALGADDGNGPPGESAACAVSLELGAFTNLLMEAPSAVNLQNGDVTVILAGLDRRLRAAAELIRRERIARRGTE